MFHSLSCIEWQNFLESDCEIVFQGVPTYYFTWRPSPLIGASHNLQLYPDSCTSLSRWFFSEQSFIFWVINETALYPMLGAFMSLELYRPQYIATLLAIIAGELYDLWLVKHLGTEWSSCICIHALLKSQSQNAICEYLGRLGLHQPACTYSSTWI